MCKSDLITYLTNNKRAELQLETPAPALALEIEHKLDLANLHPKYKWTTENFWANNCKEVKKK